MQIIDKYGYLEGALDYIEKNMVSGRGLQKIAKKARINEDLIKNLSLELRGFSEKKFLAILQSKIEDRHSSEFGAEAEISVVNVSIQTYKKRLLILVDVVCEIVVDEEMEDEIKISAKIFSKDNIQIYAS